MIDIGYGILFNHLDHLFNPQDSNFEILSVNDCFALPCHNEATCIPLHVGFTCTCPPGYKGSLCDQIADPCISSPCLNFGHCSNRHGDYICECQDGFTGKDCEVMNGGLKNSF